MWHAAVFCLLAVYRVLSGEAAAAACDSEAAAESPALDCRRDRRAVFLQQRRSISTGTAIAVLLRRQCCCPASVAADCVLQPSLCCCRACVTAVPLLLLAYRLATVNEW